MYINFSKLFGPIKFVTEVHLCYEIRMRKVPQIPFAFECNQPNGNLVDLGKNDYLQFLCVPPNYHSVIFANLLNGNSVVHINL